eukprot:gene8895-18412_t
MSYFSTEFTTCPEVCYVGYALNKKKMRRSQPSDALNSHDMSNRTDVWRGGGLADILTYQPNDIKLSGIVFQRFDFDVPIEDQLTEDIDNMDIEQSREKIDALKAYLKLNSRTVMVDPIDSVRNVVSRARTCVCLQQLCDQLEPVRRSLFTQPLFVLVNEPSDAASLMTSANMHFPVICKPVVVLSASGLSQLHTPCVMQQYRDHGGVFYKVYVIGKEDFYLNNTNNNNNNKEKRKMNGDKDDEDHHHEGGGGGGLKEEEEVDDDDVNGGDVNEVDCLGDRLGSKEGHDVLLYVESQGHGQGRGREQGSRLPKPHSITTSPSTNTNTNVSGSGSHVGNGDNCNQSSPETNGNIGNGNVNGYESMMMMPPDCPIPRERFQATAEAIQRAVGLSLFGFDVIVPTSSVIVDGDSSVVVENYDSSADIHSIQQQPELVVIDVNFFPSYKEVSDFPSRFKSFLRTKAGLLEWK